uniref:MACPF domain-containing protein n=1 Tax=Strigamia maritima TaxID=126957 RepID=T1IS11_STRMM
MAVEPRTAWSKYSNHAATHCYGLAATVLAHGGGAQRTGFPGFIAETRESAEFGRCMSAPVAGSRTTAVPGSALPLPAFPHFLYAKLVPCPDVPKLKILPGIGWDALKDKDTKQLLQVTYDQCKTTFDGKLLIPDNADAFALKSQEIEVKSSIFEHWSTYIPPTSASFKIATNVWPKESEMRQVVYRVHLTALMDDVVKGRFMQVIGALVRDKTEEAKNLTEKIVSDYGTHYSNIVDVGAVIIKEDHLKNDFLRAHDGNRQKILSASKLSLLAVGFPLEYTQDLDSSLVNEYNDAIVDKKIQNFGALNWDKGAKAEYVVAVDKSGDLLSGLVTSSNFPYYPNTLSTMLIRVKQMFNDAIRDYYERNIHRGCTQPKSSNFEFAANVDDGSCCNSITSDNLERIIERQETEISLFKQQTVYLESNHSMMKIQNLEDNFGKLTKQENEHSVKIENCEKSLITISTANNELAMAVAEDKNMLSNKIDKLENICDLQQNEMKGKLGKLENQTEKQIEDIEMNLSNKIETLEKNHVLNGNQIGFRDEYLQDKSPADD